MSSSKPSNNYPPELRERAIRMVAEVRGEYTSDWAAAQSVADKLGIGTPQTVLNWVRKAQVDAEVNAVKANYEKRIEGMEKRIETLEADNARLKQAKKASSSARTSGCSWITCTWFVPRSWGKSSRTRPSWRCWKARSPPSCLPSRCRSPPSSRSAW